MRDFAHGSKNLRWKSEFDKAVKCMTAIHIMYLPQKISPKKWHITPFFLQLLQALLNLADKADSHAWKTERHLQFSESGSR